MRIFGRRKREIERLNRELNRLRCKYDDRCREINELIDNPYSEESIRLRLIRVIDLDIQRAVWYGEVKEGLNFNGIY